MSDSTEAFDRGDKFNDYQTLPSLEEYVLINTKHQRVEILRRQPNGLWLLQTYAPNLESAGPSAFDFQSLDLEGTFAELYEDVTV